ACLQCWIGNNLFPSTGQKQSRKFSLTHSPITVQPFPEPALLKSVTGN
ncbi:hypothetical protein EGM_16539, partial [Macaca fascicularis]